MGNNRTVSVITDQAEVTYALDAAMALSEVRDPNNARRLVIISEGKSTKAYEVLAGIAMDDRDLICEFAQFVCEDGELHEHAFVSRCYDTANFARQAIDLIFSAVQETPEVTRRELQRRLGWMLGYGMRAINEFTRSEVGKQCVCDCCGGAETAERRPSLHDAHARRTARFVQ